MRKIRVRIENAEKLTRCLRENGYVAEWTPGPPHTSYDHGCSDPSCCMQHCSFYSPEEWATIETDASGTAAHRIWVAAKLVRR